MPTPGMLIAAISACFGIPETTVFQHDRMLVQSGARQPGSRGRHASVTTTDAANLLIAIFGAPAFGPAIKESASTLGKFEDLPAWEGFNAVLGKWKRTLPTLRPGHSFRDALAEIISNYASGRFATPLNVWPELKQIIPEETQNGVWTELPATEGVFEPGVLNVRVSIQSPDPRATIVIMGWTSIPTYQCANEQCEYFPFINEEQAERFEEGSSWHQIRIFDEDALKAIAKIFEAPQTNLITA